MNSSYWVTDDKKDNGKPKPAPSAKKSKWDQKTRPNSEPKQEKAAVKETTSTQKALHVTAVNPKHETLPRKQESLPVKATPKQEKLPVKTVLKNASYWLSGDETKEPGTHNTQAVSAEKTKNELAKKTGGSSSTVAGLSGKDPPFKVMSGKSAVRGHKSVEVVNIKTVKSAADGKSKPVASVEKPVIPQPDVKKGKQTEKCKPLVSVKVAPSSSDPRLHFIEADDHDIEKLRLFFESDHEWTMRKAFIVAHKDKFPKERLVCLANCFINTELYGSRYPEGVMQQLSELKQNLGGILEELRVREKAKREAQEVKFVKASSSSGTGHESSHKLGHSGSSAPVIEPPVGSFEAALLKGSTSATRKRKLKDTEHPDSKPKVMAFVKSDTDYKSTDIVSTNQHERSHGYQAALKNFLGASAGGQPVTCELTQKFYTLREKLLECKDIKRANNIEYLHLILDKVKMVPFVKFSPGEVGIFCEFFIDSILIVKMQGTGKKTAKHQAFDVALENLKKPYLRVVSINPEVKELQASDEPFDSDSQSSVPEPVPVQLTKCGLQEVASRGMKRLHADAAPIQNFILMEHKNQEQNPVAAAILRQSADFSKMALTFDFREHGDQYWCRVMLEHEVLSDCAGTTKLDAKSMAAEKALEKLKRSCWTIKIKKNEDTDTDRLSRDEVLGEITAKSDKVIDSGNIGNKLLKKMGWAGGGIGKSGSGIAEPVKADCAIVNRQGLGLASEKGITSNFIKCIKDIVSDYVKSNRTDDLAFEPSFTKEERAIIHKECQKFGLKTHSHGSGDERYLVASRRRTATQLFSHIMHSGGSTSKYDLIPPESHHQEYDAD